MQSFWWPGHDLQLLKELQRQQYSTQFCDTLLQTEDISIPTHGCVLAALSPYLSEKLLASPSPPSGQRRRLQLHNVKAKTLVKLVGLLYSGVLEVKEMVEKEDVLEAAHTFGIADLVEGQKYVEMKDALLQGDCKSLGICKENGRELHESLKMQDAQVQVEMTGRKDPELEKKSCASVGTQTVSENSVENSVICYNMPPTSEPESSGGQSLNLSFSVEPKISTSNEPHVSTPRPAVPSDEESILTQSSNPVSTTTFSSDAVIFPVNNDSSFAQEDGACQEPSGSGDSMQVLARERIGVTDGDAELPGQVTRDETLGERTEKEGVCARAELTNLSDMKQMQQMVETTQISVKVKLRRRRSEGEVWEVVSMQDTDETFSVLASLKQDSSTHKKTQTDTKKLLPPPSTDLSLKPEMLNPQPAASNSQLVSVVCFTPNQTDEPESATLSQHHGSAEESDEQIGKLLEDIMRGLNILPDLEGGCRKSDAALSACQVPSTENDAGQSQLHSAGQCEFCQSDESTTDTSIRCCFAAQSQSPSVSLSAPPSDLLLQQHSAWYDSSDGSLGQSSAISCQKKIHYPQFQQPSSQADQHVLQILPLSNGNGTPLDQTFPLSCLDDFRLPPCLSPLEPVPTQQLHLSSSSNDLQQQQQPWGHRRPWLTENPGSLTFPLSTASSSRWSKQCQGHMEQSQRNSETCAETSEADLQLYCKDIKEALKCKQDEPAGGAAAPKRKRKRTGHQQNAGRGKDGMKTKSEGPERARIRTRSFVKKETASNTIMGNTALLIPVIHRAKIMNAQGVLFTKGTCGRPQEQPPEEGVPADEDSELQIRKKMEETQTSRRCEKRKRTTSEVEVKSAQSAACTSEAENKEDTTKLRSPKRPKMVSLKDFQKLIKRQHSKTQDNQVTDETAGGDEGEAQRDDTAATEEDEERGEAEENHVVFSLDENHNQLNKHGEDSNSSANDNPGSSFDALEEEEVDLSMQSETLMKNHDAGGADSHQPAVSNPHLPQENNLNTPPSEADDVSGASGMIQEEGDEEEVDILVYSPEKDPQGQTCESGLNNVDLTADEEEEEVNDVNVTADEEETNDVDVTGDEAE